MQNSGLSVGPEGFPRGGAPPEMRKMFPAWSGGPKTSGLARYELFMKLEEAVGAIEACFERMDSVYGSPVFDEWAIIALFDQRGKILNYNGPRREKFHENFHADVRLLEAELFNSAYGHGDFVFDREGNGTRFDSFMVLGEGLFLICNNLNHSIGNIAANPKWLRAQKPFVELSERIRSHPLNHPM